MDSDESILWPDYKGLGVSSEFILNRDSVVKQRIRHKNRGPKGLLLASAGSVSVSVSQAEPEPSDPHYDEDADLNAASRDRVREYGGKGHVDLERWWLASSLWQRLIPFMLLIFIVVFIMQFGFAVYCFSTIHLEEVEDPYVCRTEACKDEADSLNQFMNLAADPCKDFYDYGCGKYDNRDEDPEKIPQRVRLDHALMIFSTSQEAVIADLLKPMGDPTDQLIEFYKTCIDLRTRDALGLDPLLRIIWEDLPSSFEVQDLAALSWPEITALEDRDMIKFAHKYGGREHYSYQLLPGHQVALMRPTWLRTYGDSLKKHLKDVRTKAAFMAELEELFRRIWQRMFELDLLPSPLGPYPARTAGRTVLAQIESLLTYIYNPDVPTVPYFITPDYLYGAHFVQNNIMVILSSRSGAVPPITFTTSDLPAERTAFGPDFDPATGRLFTYLLRGSAVHTAVTVDDAGSPVPFAEHYAHFIRATYAFRIFVILATFSADIRPRDWVAYNLDKVFPDHYKQDMQGFLKIESYCLSRTVAHLSTASESRLLRLQSDEHMDNIKMKMDEMRSNLKRGLRRWYIMNERAGDLDPHMDYITREFFKAENKITLGFPLPDKEDEAATLKRERKLRFRTKYKVDPKDYFRNILESLKLRYGDKMQAWRDGTLQPVESDAINLDFVNPRLTTTNFLRYNNTINFPLLLMEPPYFLNDMPVFDYSGTGLYLAKALLQLWKQNTDDPGALKIPPAILASLPKQSKTLRVFSDCTTLLKQKNNEFAEGKTSFQRYITAEEEQGLTTLAFKVAHDLFANPERFSRLVDLGTGEVAKDSLRRAGLDAWTAPEYFANGSYVHRLLTRHPNGTVTSGPVDLRRFGNQTDYARRLQYRRLIHFENFTLSQLFFLNSINNLCFTGDRSVARWRTYKRLLNGVFEQLDEFAEAFGCSKLTPMNPSDNCFIEKY